jgi:hypothetical protein
MKAPLTLSCLLFALVGDASHALGLDQCTRTTHVSHGGERVHADHGAGWVSWIDWWSQEGVYNDLHVADCTAQQQIITRLREERIRPTREFDPRRRGGEELDRHLRRAPALRSLPELAEALSAVGEDTRIEDMTAETCACAAAYPGARGKLTPFALN